VPLWNDLKNSDHRNAIGRHNLLCLLYLSLLEPYKGSFIMVSTLRSGQWHWNGVFGDTGVGSIAPLSSVGIEHTIIVPCPYPIRMILDKPKEGVSLFHNTVPRFSPCSIQSSQQLDIDNRTKCDGTVQPITAACARLL